MSCSVIATLTEEVGRHDRELRCRESRARIREELNVVGVESRNAPDGESSDLGGGELGQHGCIDVVDARGRETRHGLQGERRKTVAGQVLALRLG